MNIKQMLADLRVERAQIDEVIVSLQRLASSRESRRGRPPAILGTMRKRGRPRGSKNKFSSRSTSRPTRRTVSMDQQPERALAAGQVNTLDSFSLPA